jgi:Transposase domain (DUF772)
MASILLRTGNEYKADHHGPLQVDRYESKTLTGGSKRPVGAGQLCACSASLVDQLDLSRFDAHYQNDRAGACAYAPSVLLKALLLAYSQGIISSRGIERTYFANVLFTAITARGQPRLS